MEVLIVEDEESIRKAIALALQRDGHAVRSAASIAEARRAWGERPADCVISDLKLPDGDGLEAAQAFGCPFIMISGYATFDDAVRALRSRAVDFFTKPVAIRDIRAAVQRSAQVAAASGWIDVPSAGARSWCCGLPSMRARLAASELLQAMSEGRLMATSDQRGIRLWCDGDLDWSQQAVRREWLQAHGIALAWTAQASVLAVPAEPMTAYDPAHEILWPPSAGEGPWDCTAWTSAGSWLLAAARAQTAVFCGLSERLRACLQACGAQVRWAPASLSQIGVSRDERADLCAPPDLDR
ncbi:MAG: response regulator [Planctomycetota bacterium]|nr:response regulator [Planctomycetota bacterium]MCX8040504.1 response regulator [Planctomycetota bacterium]MDW8373265.1 response regulator [Planctomycetota bacterium]